jgi:hypothetical protein
MLDAAAAVLSLGQAGFVGEHSQHAFGYGLPL